MAPLQFLSTAVLLFASTLMAVGGSAEAPSSSIYHLELIHIDANGGFTKDELIRRAERRSHIRAAALSGNDWTAAASTTDNDDTYMGKAIYSPEDSLPYGEYLMELAIGTKEKSFMAVVDTGSDVTWTNAMAQCSEDAKLRCPYPPYCNQDQCDGEMCVFSKTYGSKKMAAKGFIAKESLTLSCVAGPNKEVEIKFGCAKECPDCHKLMPAKSSGVVGLNKSPKSLVSQLRVSKLRVSKFSYCLSSQLKPELRSPIWFGRDKLSLDGDAAVQTTPLVNSSRAQPSSVWAYRYYVELEGISIGGDEPLVRIPNEAFNHTSVGGKGIMFVDSGCAFSHLETAAYNVLKNLLAKELKSEPFRHNGYLTCFKHASGQPEPDAVLHLTGAKMRLRWSSYMHKPDEEPELSCLMIKDSWQSMSILGNFQQQNMRMLYDLRGEKLSFMPVDDCSKLK